jgi:enoyl-CoA hydratase/carnithine racemase
MQLTTVRLEVHDHIADVVLNRPQVINAFNGVMETELQHVWHTVRADDDIRVVVLSGAGDKGFCSGWDRKSDADTQLQAKRTANVWARNDVGEQISPKSNKCWKPVIAAVHGITCGGAFYLLGESDIIIAADDAQFFDPHTTFGLTPVFEPALMRLRMPYGEVMRMSLMGNDERIAASRAYEIGLVSEVVPRADLLSTAHTMAAAIASKPPAAVQGAVYSLWQTQNMSVHEMQTMGTALCALGNTAAAQELAAGSAGDFGGGRTWNYRVRT